MTKAEEIAVLDKAIKQLGPDSYLGPWLAQVRGEVESSIRSDFFPMITLADAANAVKEIERNANEKCAKVIAEATEKANKISRDAEQHRDGIASRMRDALRALERW